jgi:O-antigen/teichoic acid export membrane protein
VGGSAQLSSNGSPPNSGIPILRHSLTLSSAGVFLASLAIQFIGFIATVALYHYVGTGNSGQTLLGTVQLYLLIGSSINNVADLRIGSAFVFFVARGRDPRGSTGTYLILRSLMVGLAGLTIFALAPVSVLGATLAPTPQDLEIVGAFAAMPLLWSLSTVYNQLLVAQGNSLRAQVPSLVEACVRTPILVYVAIYSPSIWSITIAYAIGALASAVVSLPTTLRLASWFKSSEARLMFRYAWPLMGGLMLGFLATNSIPFLVAAKFNTQQLNIFLAANAFRILALSIPAAIIVPLFPYLSGKHKQAEYETVRSGTWQALRYTAIVIVPGVVALVVYRVNFLNILANASYAHSAATPLAILAISSVPLALSQVIGTALNSIGQQRLELYLTSAQIVALFGTAFLLFPPITLYPGISGVVAASVATLASALVALFLNTYFMHRLMAVRIRLRSIVSIVVSAAVSFFAVSQFNSHLPVNRYYQLLLGVLIGYTAYLLILALIGELSRQDVRLIGGSIGIPRRLTDPFARLCWREDSPAVNAADLSHARGLRPLELPETFTGEGEHAEVLAPVGPATPDEESFPRPPMAEP